MNTLKRITKHSLIPLLLGGLIYVLFRSQSLIMFGWVNAIGMYELINLLRAYINAYEVLIPNWFIYSLPDGLWIFSFTSALIIVNGCKWNEYKVWLLLPIGFGIEFLQLLGIFKGTFDVNDLFFYFIGIVSSVLKLGKINKKLIINILK